MASGKYSVADIEQPSNSGKYSIADIDSASATPKGRYSAADIDVAPRPKLAPGQGPTPENPETGGSNNRILNAGGSVLDWLNRTIVQPFEGMSRAGSETMSEMTAPDVDPRIAAMLRAPDPIAREYLQHLPPETTFDEGVDAGSPNAIPGLKRSPTLGMRQAAGELIGGVAADPRNWPFFAQGAARAVLQRTTTAGFTALMSKGAYDSAKQYAEIMDDKTVPDSEKQRLGTHVAVGGTLAALTGTHALTGPERLPSGPPSLDEILSQAKAKPPAPAGTVEASTTFSEAGLRRQFDIPEDISTKTLENSDYVLREHNGFRVRDPEQLRTAVAEEKTVVATEAAQEKAKSNFARAFASDREGMVQRYDKLPEAQGGRYIASDVAKELSPDYSVSLDAKRDLGDSVHGTSSQIAKQRFLKSLETVTPEQNRVVLLTGVPGAGKTTAFGGKFDADVHAVYEGNFSNADITSGTIDKIIAAGGKPEVVIVTADPRISLERIVDRANTQGRIIPLTYLADAYAAMGKGMRELKAKYGDKVAFYTLDNSVQGREPVRYRGIELPEGQDYTKNVEGLRNELQQQLEQLRDAGQVSENAYRAISLRRSIGANRLRNDGELGQGSQGLAREAGQDRRQVAPAVTGISALDRILATGKAPTLDDILASTGPKGEIPSLIQQIIDQNRKAPTSLQDVLTKRTDILNLLRSADVEQRALAARTAKRQLGSAASTVPDRFVLGTGLSAEAAKRQAELGPLGNTIPADRFTGHAILRTLGIEQGAAPAIREAAKSADPIEANAARAIEKTQEIELPEVSKVIGDIRDAAGKVTKAEASDALIDGAERNLSPLGNLKNIASKYVLRTTAGYLSKQGQAGKTFADGLLTQSALKDSIGGKWSADYISILSDELLGLKGEVGPSRILKTITKSPEFGKQFRQVVDLVEGRPVPHAAPNVVRAAERLTKLFDDVGARLEQSGVELVIPTRAVADEFKQALLAQGAKSSGTNIRIPFRRRPDYFPHIFDVDVLNKPERLAELRQSLVDNGTVTNVSAADRFIRQILLPKSEKLAGNIQRARTNDSPFYRRDPAVPMEYFEKAAQKISEVEHWGGYNEVGLPELASALIDQIRRENGDHEFAETVARRQFGYQEIDQNLANGLKTLTSWSVATQLPLAVIANVTQVSNALWRTSVNVGLRGIVESLRHFSKNELQALRDGAIIPTAHSELMSALGLRARPGAFGFLKDPGGAVLKYTGFLKAETWNRVSSYTIGKFFAREMRDRLFANPLDKQAHAGFREWLGLDPERILKQGELLDSDIAYGAKHFADKTQFRSDLPSLPFAWQTGPVAKLLLLYKSFGYHQAKLWSEAMSEGVRTGNLRLILKTATIPLIVGEGVVAVRNLLTGKDRDDSKVYQTYGTAGRILEDLSYGSGMGIMTDAMMNMVYDPYHALANILAGPVVGKAEQVTGAVGADILDALVQKRREKGLPAGVRTVRAAAGLVPGVAPILSPLVRKATETAEERKKRLSARHKH